ncbi:uncharacterized protein LOC106174603 [Lingula anatina]|uniref:Uncharacterized protein LOC106174603 n=1 Tax=Lingula anatina TaxID=7574 RepID=A0A1S3JMS9_LINAN|nr:uncharacterized protein LOC106174603 [Lingula anatina]XP_013411690.1 uncharacterized protein LOC106174603 [Lingula anatina]|eukprot:XP_013411689.1 uncharacterized protein LOC106174603 [Lingula anatina]
MELMEDLLSHVFQDIDANHLHEPTVQFYEEGCTSTISRKYERLLRSYSNSPMLESVLLCKLARIDFMATEYELSLDRFESALDKARDLKHSQLECSILYGFGNCYLQLKRYKDAIQKFQIMGEIASRNDDQFYQAVSHCSLAKSYASQNETELEKASHQIEHCVKILKGTPKNSEHFSTISLLCAQVRLHVAKSAINRTAAERQLHLAKQDLLQSQMDSITVGKQAAIWLCLAQIHLALCDHVTALQNGIQAADNAVSNTMKGDCFALLSIIYFRLGCRDLGFRCADLAVEIFKMLNYQMKMFDVNLNISYAFLEFKEFDVTHRYQLEAEDVSKITGYLQGATVFAKSLQIRLSSDKHKLAFSEQSREASEILQMIHINRDEADEALFCAESTRSNSLISWIETRFEDDPAKRQILKFFAVSVSTLGMMKVIEEVCDTGIMYSYISNRLFNGFIVWIFHTGDNEKRNNILTKVIPCSYHKLQSTIKMLQMTIASKSREIGIVGRDAFVRDRNALKEDDIEGGSEHSLQGSCAILRELYTILLEPIEKEARIIREEHKSNGAMWRLLIIPNSELFLVPFPALVNSWGQYLCRIWKVSVVSSLKLLSHLRGLALKEDSQKTFLVIGNPLTPTGAGLCFLPGAEREAKNVAALFPHAKLLVGKMARKNIVMEQMKDAQVIHFACHGCWTESYLALASNSDDLEECAQPKHYRLTADEIAHLTLKAGLVVLSACNSGRGRVTGEGIDGLARAFFLAGARAVLVALWQLPDAATVSIMTSFYSNFKSGQSASSALRQAMEDCQQDFKDPFYWAAFYLMGDDVYYSNAVPEWLLLGHFPY